MTGFHESELNFLLQLEVFCGFADIARDIGDPRGIAQAKLGSVGSQKGPAGSGRSRSGYKARSRLSCSHIFHPSSRGPILQLHPRFLERLVLQWKARKEHLESKYLTLVVPLVPSVAVAPRWEEEV